MKIVYLYLLLIFMILRYTYLKGSGLKPDLQMVDSWSPDFWRNQNCHLFIASRPGSRIWTHPFRITSFYWNIISGIIYLHFPQLHHTYSLTDSHTYSLTQVMKLEWGSRTGSYKCAETMRQKRESLYREDKRQRYCQNQDLFLPPFCTQIVYA